MQMNTQARASEFAHQDKQYTGSIQPLKQNTMNANDDLREYTGADNYYRYLCGLLITDGAKALADRFQCYWFLDIIASYQYDLKDEEFQVWTLQRKEDNSASATCTDGNDNVLKFQHVPFTDFEPTSATIWVENGVALLPSEH